MKAAILRTLAYHHLFQAPLTIEQIHGLLITPVPFSLASVRRSATQMLRKHQIIRRGPYYALLNFSQQDVRAHTSRTRASREKLAIARRAADIIALVPWVKIVAVTGALAMENADESDDIDLMVVTEKNRLWLVRPLAMSLVSLFFKRRKPLSILHTPYSILLRNTLCLNLWLDEDALKIPEDQRNLYTAHELAQMRPLINRGGMYERMMSVNAWGRKFLANAWEGMEGRGPRAEGRGKHKSILDVLNRASYQFQLWYMRSKMTTERVSLHAAYFHPGNRGKDILRRYRQLLRKSLNTEKPKKNAGDALLEFAKHAVPGPKDLASNMFAYLYGEKSDYATKKRKRTIKYSARTGWN